MPTVYKNAQLQAPASNIDTYGTLYNTGAASTAVISTITITNTTTTTSTYRIGIMGSAGTPSGANWLIYNGTITGSDTLFLTFGLALGNSQFIRVSSSSTSTIFGAYVSEIT